MMKSVDTNALGVAPLRDLMAWAQATEQEIGELRGQMLPLEKRLAAASERLDLIRRLIGLAESDGERPPTAGRNTAQHRKAAGSNVPAGATVEDYVEAILSESGEPMHIGAIRDVLIERGVPLPGRGDEANIIIRLRRNETLFTRTGRGTYGLAVWGLPTVAPTRSKAVRRRRTVKKL